MERNEPSMHRGAVVKAEPIAAWRWDPAGKALTWSEGMFEVFGVKPNEFGGLGNALVGFAHPEDRAMVTEQLVAIREGAKPRPLECRLVRADGAVRWVRVEGDTFTDEVGKLVVVGIVRDITERKRAEEALQMRDETNRTLLDAIPDMMFRLDKNGTYLDFIPAKGQRPLVPPTEFVGRTVDEILPPAPAREIMRHVKGAVESGETLACEYELTEDGKARHYEARIVATRPDEVLVLARDVSEQKRAEEALRTSEEKWRSVLENAHDFVCLVTPDLKISFLNRTVPGWEMEDVVGKDALDFVASQHHDAAREAVERIIRTGVSESFEIRGTGPDGGEAWYLCGLGPVKVVDKVVSVACVCGDVTDRKQAELSLRESEERYRTVCEKSIDGISLVVDGKIEYVNASLCEMLGYSEDELRGRPALELVVPEERERVTERLQALPQGGGDRTSRFRFVKKDGSTVLLEGSGRAIQLRGKPAFLHVVRDVTEYASDVAEDEMAALAAARAALEEVAPLLPRDSLADLASARALSRIYKLLTRREG